MLIANIGLQHFGNFYKAKELIMAANDHGADLIKAIAITPYHTGQFEKEFYQMCSFSFDEYIELIEYARDLKNDLFYEISGMTNRTLEMVQNWISISEYEINNSIPFTDEPNNIMYLSAETMPYQNYNMSIVYDMKDRDESIDYSFQRMDILKNIYSRNIGFHDRSVGIEKCIRANDSRMSNIIEKHLTLEKGILFNGRMIPENVYSVMPKEFDKLANNLMVFREDATIH